MAAVNLQASGVAGFPASLSALQGHLDDTWSQLVDKTEFWINHPMTREFCVQATQPDTVAKEPPVEKVTEVTAASSGRFIRPLEGRVPVDFISSTDQVA